MVNDVNSQDTGSMSHHLRGLVGTGSGTLKEWLMHMVMRHRVVYAYANETQSGLCI